MIIHIPLRSPLSHENLSPDSPQLIIIAQPLPSNLFNMSIAVGFSSVAVVLPPSLFPLNENPLINLEAATPGLVPGLGVFPFDNPTPAFVPGTAIPPLVGRAAPCSDWKPLEPGDDGLPSGEGFAANKSSCLKEVVDDFLRETVLKGSGISAALLPGFEVVTAILGAALTFVANGPPG